METRVHKVLTDKDIAKIQDTIFSWRNGDGYEDIEGYCKSSTTEEIEKNNFVLTPGRYVGFADEEDDGIPFEEKFIELQNAYNKISDESINLDLEIKKNLSKVFDNA